jgi:hypothetical protein
VKQNAIEEAENPKPEPKERDDDELGLTEAGIKVLTEGAENRS